MDGTPKIGTILQNVYVIVRNVKESLREMSYQNPNNFLNIYEKYFRPCEVDLLLGDITKAKNKLGWEYTPLNIYT